MVQLAALAFAFSPSPVEAEQRIVSADSPAVVWQGRLVDGTAAQPAENGTDRSLTQRLKGYGFSLQSTDDTTGVQLKTAVLIQPLKTDNFTVAFAASAPLLKNKETTIQPYGADGKALQVSDGSADSGWLVLTDPDRSSRYKSLFRGDTFISGSAFDADNSWLSKVELIFWPADQWTMRAIFSMEHGDAADAAFLSSQMIDQSRFGVAIGVDYRILKSMVLGFDYGRYRSGQGFKSSLGDEDKALQHAAEDSPLESQFFSARLQIQF